MLKLHLGSSIHLKLKLSFIQAKKEKNILLQNYFSSEVINKYFVYFLK